MSSNTSSPDTTTFSHAELPVSVVRDADGYVVDRPTIVVNLAGTPAWINEPLGGYISPVSSTVLSGGVTVTGDLLAMVSVPERALDEAHFRSLGWDDFYGSAMPGAEADTPVLLKSAQHVVGYTPLRTADVLMDDAAPDRARGYEVRLNLWFSPAGTDCGIHREHSFIENHTQVMGIGRMQKFREQLVTSMYEEQVLAPGQTQPSMFGRWVGEGFSYPWHQYRADTDTVWLVIEYHERAMAQA